MTNYLMVGLLLAVIIELIFIDSKVTNLQRTMDEILGRKTREK